MKIIVLMSSFDTGGVERYFIDLMNWLCKKDDVEVKFFVHRNSGFLASDVDPSIEVRSFENLKFKPYLIRVLKEIRKERPDVVFTGKDVLNIALALMRPVLPFRTKTLLSQHSYFDLESEVYISKSFTQFLYRMLFDMSNGIMAVSKGIEEYLKNEIKVRRVFQIYNPVNTKRIVELSHNDEGNPLFEEKYVLFVGRLSKVKNIPLLLKAFSILCKNHPDLKLYIAGDGNERKSLSQFAEECNISDKTVFLGNVVPYSYIAYSECVCLPSFSEAMPLTAIEVLSLNKPLVATPAKGTAEILGDDYPYLLKSFDDCNELAEKLEKAVYCPEKIDFSALVAKFDIDYIGEQYYQLLKNL